jgi:hypothetical protein
MHFKASTLAAAGAAPILMLGAAAQAQPPWRQAPAGPTLTCELTQGPRAGSSFDFQGTSAQPAQVGTLCSDMAGSAGVAVAPEVAGQPGQNPSVRRSQGRYYFQQQSPNGYYSYEQGVVPTLSTWTCQFTHGPRAGSSVDASRIPGSVAAPVGSGCSDGQGSTGVAVRPSPGEEQQQNQGPY